MMDVRPMIRDYKMNVPLHMLEAKYGIPIHKIIKIMHTIVTRRSNVVSTVNQ